MMGGSINHDMIDDATASVAQEYANNFGKPGDVAAEGASKRRLNGNL